MPDKKNIIEINAMLLELLDGKICDERFSLLQDWLGNDEAATGYYADFMKNFGALCHHSVLQNDIKNLDDSAEDEALWQMLAESEKSAEAIQVDEYRHEEEKPQLITDVRKIARQPSRVSRLSLYTAIVSTTALIVILLYVVSNPRIGPAVVATLADAIEAKWDTIHSPVQVGGDLRVGPRKLLAGFAKIGFDKGTEVLVQAPAEFTLEAQDQMFLLNGRVFCKVPSGSVGFVVRTPNACIVDYGTEFGVTARSSGETEAHVFKGSVDLRGGSDPVRFKGFKKLIAGTAGRVDDKGTVSEVTFKAKPRQFVKKLPDKDVFARPGVRFDLADVVGGGDGFGSGRINQGIDVLTGRWCNKLKTIETLNGPNRYMPVGVSEFIDGVFIADNRSGDVVINSAGDVLELEYTTSGEYWGYIANGAFHHNGTRDILRHPLVLDGQKCGTEDNPAITVHSNLGITFDLNKFRSAMPGLNISKFTSKAGISETVSRFNKQNSFLWKSDFRVLIDGREVFSRQTIASKGSFLIDVPIQRHDRYLTLVVVDGGDSVGFDWAVFVNPTLELEYEGIEQSIN